MVTVWVLSFQLFPICFLVLMSVFNGSDYGCSREMSHYNELIGLIPNFKGSVPP